MARKKITPEDIPKTVAPEESAAADVGEVTQSGLPPDADDAPMSGTEAVPMVEPNEDADGMRVGGDPPEESREEAPAGTAAVEMPSTEISAEEDTAPVIDEDLPAEEDAAAAQPASVDAISAAVEYALEISRGDAGPPEVTTEFDAGIVNMTAGSIADLNEPSSESEPADYSIDLLEKPEDIPLTDAAGPNAEESEWGFEEPTEDSVKEEDSIQASSAVMPKIQVKSDRQLFYELRFNAIDRDLTPEERQAWNAIYASYRGRSALSGKVSGVDPRSVYVWNRRTEEREKLTMFCPVVMRYLVPIVIPASEMWETGKERPDFVTKNISGANLDFIIIKVDREGGFAVGSRRLASRSQRYFFAHREDLHRVGARIKCRMVAVGPRRCLVECYGHDIELTQREMRYAAIPDLRTEYHPGDERECIVKLYDPVKDELVISVKETEVNPFIGAELRHPVGCRRLAMISGKYGGGVFCNLPDGTVCMCNYSYQHDDSDFVVGENVILVVQRYDTERLQMFGKILSKW